MEQSHLTNSLIFLIMYFLIMNKSVECKFCQAGMKYHRHTHSCMIVIHSYLNYKEANKYCANIYSGGHLVYILDKETDTFITSNFVTDGHWYYIGLSDKEKNGVYKWINGQNVSYTNWSRENHTPHRDRDYVVASRYGWNEVSDAIRKFICQSVAAKSLSFSLNHQDFVNSTREVTALANNTLRCEVYDIDDHHLQLLYQNSDGTVSKIEEKLGKSLTYTFRPGFNSSGVYVCQVRQLEGKSVSLTGTLKVISNATYCDEQDPNHNVIVAGHTDVTFHKFCVFVYPRPTTLTVFTGFTKHIPESRYDVNFTYIDETSARGEINIRFYNVTSSDYGRYYIFFYHKYVSSILYFNIAGPPICPNKLTSEELDQNTVRLTWSPIAYEISEQLFKIFKADRLSDVHVATVSDKKKMFLSYNVTELSPNTKYSFYLHVKAGQFEIPCKHVITSVLIKDTAGDTTKVNVNSSSELDIKEGFKNVHLFIVTVVMAAVAVALTVSTTVACYRYYSTVERRTKNDYDVLDIRLNERAFYHTPKLTDPVQTPSKAGARPRDVTNQSLRVSSSPRQPMETEADPYSEIRDMYNN